MPYMRQSGEGGQHSTPSMLSVWVPARDKGRLHLFSSRIPVDQLCAVMAETDWVVHEPSGRSPRKSENYAEPAEDVTVRQLKSCCCWPCRIYLAFGISVTHFAAIARPA